MRAARCCGSRFCQQELKFAAENLKGGLCGPRGILLVNYIRAIYLWERAQNPKSSYTILERLRTSRWCSKIDSVQPRNSIDQIDLRVGDALSPHMRAKFVLNNAMRSLTSVFASRSPSALLKHLSSILAEHNLLTHVKLFKRKGGLQYPFFFNLNLCQYHRDIT